MRLCVLGSGTAIAHPRRGASGYALRAPDGSWLLLECGPGSSRRWPKHGIRHEAVRGVLVTHHHVDHCADLAAVLFARALVAPGTDTVLRLVGPQGHRAHLDALASLYGLALEGAVGRVEVVELRDREAWSDGPFDVEARHVQHVPGALGVRVRCAGRTLAFSGDSGPCAALVALLRGADLALVECSYPAGRASDRHLNAFEAGRMAAEAGVGRLLLTHLYPETDAVDVVAQVRQGGYRGEVAIADDGLEVDV
ncbi:MAG: MBL fold metallo-hydrolase [Myxococcota bacterium]|nr:MBL fold metallo-hydrolase [Myxococcota bacterium]MDW8361240.1 MBL fold metallo-hydrolase [Myxococcales bacterium]